MNPAIPDIPIEVPIPNANEDTEWNDILRQHGILPPKPPSPSIALEAALESAAALLEESRLPSATLDELDELEDIEDERLIEQYRQARLAEITALQKKEIFGSVFPLQKRDYERDVTEASKDLDRGVVVLMTGEGVDSRVMQRVVREAASKWRDVKFCEIKANMCVEGYPERNCPTLLAYRKGEMAGQCVGLGGVGGREGGVKGLEQWLAEVGVIERGDRRRDLGGEDEEEENEEKSWGIRSGGTGLGVGAKGAKKAAVEDDEDSDWD